LLSSIRIAPLQPVKATLPTHATTATTSSRLWVLETARLWRRWFSPFLFVRPRLSHQSRRDAARATRRGRDHQSPYCIPRHPTRAQKHDVTTLSCYHHVMLPPSLSQRPITIPPFQHMFAQAQKRISGVSTARAGLTTHGQRRALQRDTRSENAAGRSQASRQLFRWSHSLLPALSRPFNSHNRGNQQQQTHAHDRVEQASHNYLGPSPLFNYNLRSKPSRTRSLGVHQRARRSVLRA
jgi:hypothetical protein